MPVPNDTVPNDSPPRPRLSVAMIVRNEEAFLADSIASIRSIADEIVVLDTGSTDQTVAVARGLGVAIASMPWSDNFSAARNCCLGLTSGDWVLWLDAGERLSEESSAQLRQFVDREADSQTAYTLWIEVPPLDPSASAEQAARVRLIPNRAELRFEGCVHETLQPSIEAAGLNVAAAPGRIVRHPRQHDQALKVIKANRDLALASKEEAEKGDSPRLLLAMGEAYGNLGMQEQARAAFRRAIEAAEHGSTDMLEAYYGLLTAFDGNQYLRDIQLNVCLEALEIYPFDAQLLLAMASYLHSWQRLDLAVRAHRAAVEYGQVDLQAWHLRELAEVAAVCLSVTLLAQQADDEARAVLEQALRQHPHSRRLLRRLLDVNVKLRRSGEALALVERLAPSADEREALHDAVRGACKAIENEWTAALGYLESAYVAGCRDPFCLRWLAVTLLSNGQLPAAQQILQQWQGIEPANVELRAYLRAIEDGNATPPADQDLAASSPAPSDYQQTSDYQQKWMRVDQASGVFQVATSDSSVVDRSDVSA